METSDGIKREETGKLVDRGEFSFVKVKGSYSYTDNDGKLHEVYYIADDKGYRASSGPITELPVPVFIPSAALASLAGK